MTNPAPDFEAPVRRLDAAACSELRRLIEALDAQPSFVRSSGFFDVSYVPAVDALLMWLDRHGLIVPFDWGAWTEGPSIRPDAVAARPVADAVRLLTALVRADRFSAGAFGGALDTGLVQACLRRILVEVDG